MIVYRVSRSSDGVYQIKVLVSSAGARLNTSVNYIGNSRCELFFWWPLNLYHSGNTDEKPIHVIHMHSTRFRLSSNTQPVTSLLTPSGPPCSGRTLLIRLLSAKSLNIIYTRNTANLRSHNVTGGENLIQRAKQLMAPWITQGRNWQFTADNHLSSVLAVYGGESRHHLIFSILLGCLTNLSHHLSTTIRRLTINKVPPVF